MWLACYTQEEIAETTGLTQQQISEVLQKTADLPKSVKVIASHLVDFDPPIYNIWMTGQGFDVVLVMGSFGFMQKMKAACYNMPPYHPA